MMTILLSPTLFLTLMLISIPQIESCPCADPGQICNTQTQTCSCDIGHYLVSKNENSSDILCDMAYGSYCVTRAECYKMNLNNSVCTQGVCQCRRGFFYPSEPMRYNCYEAFGSTCIASRECVDILLMSECSSGQCRCIEGYYYVNSTIGCIPVYESACSGHIDCESRGGSGYKCDSQLQCGCVDQYYYNLSNHSCRSVTGSPCQAHQDCTNRGAAGSYICGSNQQCHDPCSTSLCENNSTCVTDKLTLTGYQCLCASDYAGHRCSRHTKNLVLTKLLVASSVNVSTKSFAEGISKGLVVSLVFGLCRDNDTCASNIRTKLNVELIKVERLANSSTVRINYVVLDHSLVRSAEEVARVLSILSPSEMSQRLGYSVQLPATAVIPGQPPEYCQMRWGFEVPSHETNPVSEAFTQNLEQRLSNVIYRAMARDQTILTLLFTESITSKIVNISVSAGKIRILFTAYNDGTCLPAVSMVSLIKNMTLYEITPIAGYTPIQYPDVAQFSTDSYIYYKNSFILTTLMPVSRGDVYFALSWIRLETGLSRVFHRALQEYVTDLRFELSPHPQRSTRYKRRMRRQSVVKDLEISSKHQSISDGDSKVLEIPTPVVSKELPINKLLDIRRVDNTTHVELIGYLELGGVVLPIEHVLFYMNKTGAEAIAIQLEEVIPEYSYIKAFDPSLIGGADRSSSNMKCVEEDEADRTLRYWTRSVLIVPPKTDVDTSVFSERMHTLLGRLFIGAVGEEFRKTTNQLFEENKLPTVCVQMVGVRRLSYDTGHTELVYFVTLDGALVSAQRLVDLSQYYIYRPMAIALILGYIIDEEHIVEPYSQPLNQTSLSHTADKEFLLTFIENYVEADWPPANYSLRLHFSVCGLEKAQVIVEAPMMLPSPYKASLTVYPYRENYLILPTELMMRGSGIQRKAILITSDIPINVLALNRDYLSLDSTLVLPISQLGTEYYPASLWPGGTKSQAAVVTKEDTQISIQFSQNNIGVVTQLVVQNSTLPGLLSLRSLEILQIQLAGYLTGTKITSNKPVAVYSGNIAASMSGHTRDHLYEQIAPTKLSAGTSFIIPSLPVDNPYYPVKVKVISTQTNTLVSVPAHNRTSPVAESGGIVNVELTTRDFSLFINSDKPVIAYVFMASSKVGLGDPSMLQLLPSNHKSNFYTVNAPNSDYKNFLHYVTVHVETSLIEGLRLNSQPVPVSRYDWHTVLYSSPEQSIISFPIEPGQHLLWHEDQRVGFSAYAYGVSAKESYAHRVGSCPSDSRPTDFTKPVKPRTEEPTLTTTGASFITTALQKTTQVPKVPTTTINEVPVKWVNRTTAQPATVVWINKTEAILTVKPSRPSVPSTIAPSTLPPTTNKKPISRPPTTKKKPTSQLPTTKKEPTTQPPSTKKKLTTQHRLPTTTGTIAPNQVNIGPEHLLWFTVKGQDSELNRDEIEDALSKMYLEKEGSGSKEKREVNGSQSAAKSSIHVWKTEPYLNDTAVLFFMVDSDGNPVNASESIKQLSPVTKEDIEKELNVTITSPVSEYSKSIVGSVDEAAALPETNEDDGKRAGSATVPAVLLSLLFGLVAAAVVVIVLQAKHRRTEKKKTDESQEKKEGPVDLASGDVIHSSTPQQEIQIHEPDSLKKVTEESAKTNETPPKISTPNEVTHGGDAGRMPTIEHEDVDNEGQGQSLHPGQGQSLYPEYPLSLSSEQLDDVMAPYLTEMANRNERFRNKKLLRKQKHGGNNFKPDRREKKYMQPRSVYNLASMHTIVEDTSTESDFNMRKKKKKEQKRAPNLSSHQSSSTVSKERPTKSRSLKSQKSYNTKGESSKSRTITKLDSGTGIKRSARSLRFSKSPIRSHLSNRSSALTQEETKQKKIRIIVPDVSNSGDLESKQGIDNMRLDSTTLFKMAAADNRRRKYRLRRQMENAKLKAARSDLVVKLPHSDQAISRLSKSSPFPRGGRSAGRKNSSQLHTSSSANSLPGSVLEELPTFKRTSITKRRPKAGNSRSVQDHSQSSMQDNQRKKSTLSIHNSQNLGSMRSIDEPSNHKTAVSTEEAHLTKGPEQIVSGSLIDIKSSTSIGKQHGLMSANVVSESVLLNGAISEV